MVSCSIDKKSSLYTSGEFDDAHIQIYITLDPQIDTYQRSVYSFLDMFGYIGGIFGLFKTFGYFVVNFFAQKEYYSSILSNLYHFEADHINEVDRVKFKIEDLSLL